MFEGGHSRTRPYLKLRLSDRGGLRGDGRLRFYTRR